MEALARYWRKVPPVALQLRRIARFLGLEDPPEDRPEASTKKRSLDDDLQALAAGGVPIFEGRPNDPMLDLLDL